MFTLSDGPVKFVALLVLLVGSLLWSLYELRGSRGLVGRTSAWLHAGMAAVMLLMVPRNLWLPFHSVVPLPVLVALFAAATGWFLWLGVRELSGAHAAHQAGHAVMFGAMTWHLGGMAALMSAAAMPLNMTGMHNDSMHAAHTQAMAANSTTAWWVALAGVPFMAYLLLAGLRAAAKAVLPGPAPKARLSAASHSAMNLAMFWMSTGLLVPIAGFMAFI